MRLVVGKDTVICYVVSIYVCTNGGLQELCETADKYDDFKITEST